MKREFFLAAILCTVVSAAHEANAATIYACDGTSVFSIDTVSGARTVIAGTGVGTGVTMVNPRGIVAMSPTQLAVSATAGLGQGMIAVIDLNTLDRISLSQRGDFKGPDWYASMGIGRDSSGNLYMVDPDVGVLRFNSTSGNRTVISGLGAPYMDIPKDILPFDTNRIFVTGAFQGTVFQIDNSTGIRNDVYTDPPALTTPQGMAIESLTGRVLIADSFNAYVARWNPDALTGSVASSGGGAALLSPFDIACAEDGTIYVADAGSSTRGIGMMNGTTGDITPISANSIGWNVGSGPEFSNVSARLYVATPVSSAPSATRDWFSYQ